MSVLHTRLSEAFVHGHRQKIPDLLSDEWYHTADSMAEAAVLIAVRDRPDNPEGPAVILTQRPATMRDHPGQVAFPGGKLEPGEEPICAALREAQEELAIDPAQVRVIGASDLFYTGTGFIVTPVLATIPTDLPLRPDPHEVESCFEAPLSLILDPDAWRRRTAQWKGAQRDYLEIHYQEYRIWGVTAAICHNLARRLNLFAMHEFHLQGTQLQGTQLRGAQLQGAQLQRDEINEGKQPESETFDE